MKTPSKVWITLAPGDIWGMAYKTRKRAEDGLWEGEVVVGPYVLAEPVVKAKGTKKAKKRK